MSTRYKRTDWVRRKEDLSSGCSSGFGLGQWLFAWLLAGLLSSLAYAVPITTNYQGYLENTDGEPLSATVNMTFALYATAQGGSALWTESHQQVEINNGVFSLILGNTTPFDDESLEGERYLGVTVGSDPEMAPRQQLTSTFFAMRAAVAESVKAASVETEAIADGAVTGEKIAPQTITGDKIADLSGHNVTELDDVADAGSGKIISDAEREKLESLTAGGESGSSPTFNTVVVEDKLHVKKSIKVGKNSVQVTDSSVYNDSGDLQIQNVFNAPPYNTIINTFNSGKVGIGTNTPTCKLHVKGKVCADSIQTSESTVPTGKNPTPKMIHRGIWGDWHGWQYCPPKTYVCGARVRFEASQGGGSRDDDTAMNGIEFACCSFEN